VFDAYRIEVKRFHPSEQALWGPEVDVADSPLDAALPFWFLPAV
jgi:hypothetical protein